MIRILFILLLLPCVVLRASSGGDPVDKVNVLIGTTGPQGVVNYGGVCPWVTPPFGMTHWTAMTQENEISRLPYRYEQRKIIGFMGTHQPTVWMGDYGFLTLMPESGKRLIRPAERGLDIVPGSEVATPYRYSVSLGNAGAASIGVHFTASSRCGFFEFDYPESAAAHLLIEMSRVPDCEGWVKVSSDHREIVGYNSDRHNNYRGRPMGPELKKFRGYFVIQFEQPFDAAPTWIDPRPSDAQSAPTLLEDHDEIRGERVGTLVSFPDRRGGPVRVRIGSSFISLDQARDNLRREIPGWNFAEVAGRTRQEWNDLLGRVEVEGGTPDEQVVFYTALFHTLLFPRTWDENGRYYSAFDEQIHEGVSYNDYSLWDTFRALQPLLTLVAPERVSPMIRSLLQMCDEGGWMPKWPNPTYTNIMIGTPADSVIADAFVKGFRDYDLEKAYAAMRKDAMTPPDGDQQKRWTDRAAWTAYEARAGLTYYKTLGYVPADLTSESVSCTLEYAYEDFCVAQVAKGLGKVDDYRLFTKRAMNYRNLYDPATGFMQPRLADGTFFTGDPKKYHAFTEGSQWTYLFCVMHDVPGLINLMGSSNFAAKLDENFSGGHYAYDNEPENHYPYLYAWIGQPQKTQKILTAAMQGNFRNTPDGMTGNDDCGQMSAWYVFTAMGFYPVAPGSGTYVIGRPFFPKMTLHLNHPAPGTLTIIAHNFGPGRNYVRSVRLDGRLLEQPFITHAALVGAQKLEFEMTDTP